MRYIAFHSQIDGRSIDHLLDLLDRANAPRTVYVSSRGGEFELFSVVGPRIERHGLVTIAGDVASAAVILYLLGHKRYASPSSSFFFHEVRTLVGEGGQITLTTLERVREYEREMSGRKREALQHWYNQMQLAQRWFVHFIEERTGVRSQVFLNLMRSEATLSATEAVRYGIAHEIRNEREVLHS
jgi:ATP-dependent protease ClpP protease subunit